VSRVTSADAGFGAIDGGGVAATLVGGDVVALAGGAASVVSEAVVSTGGGWLVPDVPSPEHAARIRAMGTTRRRPIRRPVIRLPRFHRV